MTESINDRPDLSRIEAKVIKEARLIFGGGDNETIRKKLVEPEYLGFWQSPYSNEGVERVIGFQIGLSHQIKQGKNMNDQYFRGIIICERRISMIEGIETSTQVIPITRKAIRFAKLDDMIYFNLRKDEKTELFKGTGHDENKMWLWDRSHLPEKIHMNPDLIKDYYEKILELNAPYVDMKTSVIQGVDIDGGLYGR